MLLFHFILVILVLRGEISKKVVHQCPKAAKQLFSKLEEEYAFPVLNVISIEKAEGITPIPHMPDYVKGNSKGKGSIVSCNRF